MADFVLTNRFKMPKVISVDVDEGEFRGDTPFNPYSFCARVDMDDGTWTYGWGHSEGDAIKDAHYRIANDLCDHDKAEKF